MSHISGHQRIMVAARGALVMMVLEMGSQGDLDTPIVSSCVVQTCQADDCYRLAVMAKEKRKAEEKRHVKEPSCSKWGKSKREALALVPHSVSRLSNLYQTNPTSKLYKTHAISDSRVPIIPLTELSIILYLQPLVSYRRNPQHLLVHREINDQA